MNVPEANSPSETLRSGVTPYEDVRPLNAQLGFRPSGADNSHWTWPARRRAGAALRP